MGERIKTRYKRVTIFYEQQEDEWRFKFRREDRRAGSLLEAYKIIDSNNKAPAKFSSKPFYYWRNQSLEPVSGKIVGVTEPLTNTSDKRPQVIVVAKGRRFVTEQQYCFPRNSKTRIGIDACVSREQEISRLQMEVMETKQTLKQMNIVKKLE